jgi:hypothetical protein
MEVASLLPHLALRRNFLAKATLCRGTAGLLQL